MKCRSCQTDNPDGAKFCKGYGQSFQNELICSNCQFVNTSDNKFCNNCGRALTEQAPTWVPIPSPPAARSTGITSSKGARILRPEKEIDPGNLL